MKFTVNVDQALVDMIEYDEGFRSRVYDDDNAKPLKIEANGQPTIGIGINLNTTLMPREVARHWCAVCCYDLDTGLSVGQHGATYVRLSDARQYALINMAFNLGLSGLMEFRKTWEYLRQEKYGRASAEALDSRWAQQVPQRAERVAGVIRTGSLSAYGL